MPKMVEFEIQPNKSLKITLIESERADVEALRDKGKVCALAELFEWQTCNGFEWLNSDETGDLTDAPMISDVVVRDDTGEFISADHCWYDNNYAVRDPIDYLLREGSIIFNYHSYV